MERISKEKGKEFAGKVMELAAAGKSNSEIAAALSITKPQVAYFKNKAGGGAGQKKGGRSSNAEIQAKLATAVPGEDISLNGLIQRMADVVAYAKRFQEEAKNKTEKLFL